MTHFGNDAELDALLGTADNAVLTAVEHGLDPDAGRAALFALVTAPEHGDRQPPRRTVGHDGNVTDSTGIRGAPAGIRIHGPVRHRSHTVDVNDLVNELLELLARISDDLDVLRHRLDRAPKGRPLAPGRVETATTLVAALLMGVQERNVGEKTALDPAEAALRETAALQGELDTAPCSKQDLQGRARATARCRQLRTFLKAARSLVAKLFADGGEQSCLLPVPTG